MNMKHVPKAKQHWTLKYIHSTQHRSFVHYNIKHATAQQ
jgi:hypothetical protein